MCKTLRLRPSSRQGWKLKDKCTSRHDMIQKMHVYEEQGIQARPRKKGGLSSPFPYEIYTKTK